MQRFIIITCLLVAVLSSHAQTIVLQSGEEYRIECVGRGKGGVAVGERFGSNTPLLYVDSPEDIHETYWLITKVDEWADGTPVYTIQHAITKAYVSYDGVYMDGRRYVSFTQSDEGGASHWYFQNVGGAWTITNYEQTSHHWHVRNTNVVGTYVENSAGVNSQFRLYNTAGQRVTHIVPPVLTLADYMQDIRFEGKRAIAAEGSTDFLLPINADYQNARYVPTRILYKDKRGTLSIMSTMVRDGDTYQFEVPDFCEQYPVSFTTNEGKELTGTLSLTFLPIVEITGDGFNGTKDMPGTICVNDGNSAKEDSVYCMRTHWRGNTSLRYPKKNFAIKLTDASGEKHDAKFLGLRKDNNWILDAMYIDPARMRNRVSTDIWNDYHTAPYYGEQEPKARTGTRGGFVEVFVNGKYEGLYCLTEKMDRKQLKLKKLSEDEQDATPGLQHGILYKAVEWDYTTYFGYEGGAFTGVLPSEPLPDNPAWRGSWEIKYPDYGDGDAIDWSPLYDHIAFMCTCSDKEFCEQVAERFDLPVLRDYYLLQELCMAFDNSAKNMLWFIYDAAESHRLSLAPWDLDGTWGRVWDGSTKDSDPGRTLRSFYMPLVSRNKIYSHLFRLDAEAWNEALAERYAELRYAGIIDAENIYERFASYAESFRASRAGKREIARWDGVDGRHINWNDEMDYIRNWIAAHITTMDTLYGYDPSSYVPVGNHPLQAGNTSATSPISYTLTGQRLLHPHRSQRGVYISGGRKIIIAR